MRLHAEFSSEPFTVDRVPDHASVARDLAAEAGVLEEFGPLGTSVAGDAEDVVAALAKLLVATFQHGASSVTLRVGRDSTVLRGVHDLDFTDGLRTLLDVTEREFGVELSRLSREDKQRAVRRLEERGAFAFRKAPEAVAERLGVSRFTVYNYLNRSAPEQAT